MTRRTNIDFFIDDYSNEIVHVDIIYRTKIKKYQKARKYGSDVHCVYCRHSHTVFNLSWKEKKCEKCGRTTKKEQWTIRCGANKLSKRVALINPDIKSYIPYPKLHYGENTIWQHR